MLNSFANSQIRLAEIAFGKNVYLPGVQAWAERMLRKYFIFSNGSWLPK